MDSLNISLQQSSRDSEIVELVATLKSRVPAFGGSNREKPVYFSLLTNCALPSRRSQATWNWRSR